MEKGKHSKRYPQGSMAALNWKQLQGFMREDRRNSRQSRAHRLEMVLPLQTRLALEVQRDNSNAYLRKLVTLIQREADDPQIVRKLCEMVLSDLNRP